MKYILHNAKWILAVELLLAVVLLVGLLVPLPGKVELKIVQSGSMEPELHVGSVVVVVPSASYKVGDIITFGKDTSKRIPTTHRIAEITRDNGSIRYITKGDANEEADRGQTAYASVIGKVVADVPRLGYVLDFARSRNGFIFMVVLPAFFVILDELITIFTTVKGIKEKELSVVDLKNEKTNAVAKKRYVKTNENAHTAQPIFQQKRISMDGVILKSL